MNIYTITLHFTESGITMPYAFTSYKEAVLYGEYAFRKYYDMTHYQIIKCLKPFPFYKLK